MNRRQFLKALGLSAAGATLATYGVFSSEYIEVDKPEFNWKIIGTYITPGPNFN